MATITSDNPTLDMTQTTQENTELMNQPNAKPKEDEAASSAKKKRWQEFKSRIESCKSYRRKLISTWQLNIDYRRGKPFASDRDEDRIAVPLDWSFTKTKQASLFSQVPQIRIDHPPDTIGVDWITSFERHINDTLRVSGIESAMDEVLPDVINAAGIGAILVSYEAITEDKDVPSVDLSTLPPELAQSVMTTGAFPDGTPVPMETVPDVVDKRYLITRISPADLLWDTDFSASDFDNAPWMGRSGKISWAQAVNLYKVTEDEKDKILGEDRTVLDKLTNDTEKDRAFADSRVNFDEIFYKTFEYDSKAKSYSLIHHLVFLEGKQEPVVDEPWQGQRLEEGVVLGATKFPIRILTLAYITDDTIPPSDSAVARPMVDELNKSRGQQMKQRERNIPMRWVDSNRIDTTTLVQIMRGNWGAVIPTQGPGDKIIGEVAKSTPAPETAIYDQIAKVDATEAWSLGPNQLGSGAGVETKGEGDTIQSNFQTRLGRERAKVAKFFCSIAEVLGGLIVLYEDPAIFGEEFDPTICKALGYSILADSTVLLDSQQRLERLINFFNFTAKTGYINMEPVLKEIATLSGLDPSVIQAPQPKPPVEPNISLRLTGSEDLTNPLTLAFLLKSGQAPEPELIEQAKQLISMVVVPAPPPLPPVMEVNPDGSTSMVAPEQPEATAPQLVGYQINLNPTPPPQPPQEPGMEGEMGPEGAAGPQVPAPPPPPIGGANPDAGLMPHVSQRSEDGGPVQ